MLRSIENRKNQRPIATGPIVQKPPAHIIEFMKKFPVIQVVEGPANKTN